jgi:RNA polymerase sigma factor (sigma-70 family)
MQYTYTSVTGVIEAEISDHWNSVLVAMDKEESNSDRRQSRHCSVPLEDCYAGEWLADEQDIACEFEVADGLEQALASLTKLQRTCFVETKLNGKTQQEVADELGKSRSTVQKAMEGAVGIMKKYFCARGNEYIKTTSLQAIR